jgi:uncharacterized protein
VYFEWDESKNEINQRKHRIDFELASRVFEDPAALIQIDRVESGEQRWQALGLAAGIQLLVVIHVYREANHGEEIIRIIPARKANPQESRRYFQ